MATYTEFYVKHTSVDATASNLNGGDGATLNTSFTITTSGSGTGGSISGNATAQAQPSRFFCINPSGTPRYGFVNSSSLYIGGNTTFTIAMTDGAGALADGTYGINFGGNWATPDIGSKLTTASIGNTTLGPPRLNVYEPATYAVAVTMANSGTAAIPITIEGYHTKPGDLRGTMTAPLIQLNSGITNSALVQVNGSYITLRNLSVATTQAGGIEINSGNNCQVINCTVAAPNGTAGINLYFGSFHIIDACLFTSNARGIYDHGCQQAQIINCRFVPTASGSVGIAAYASQTPSVIGCTFYNFTGDGIQMGNLYGLTVLNCTFHALNGNAINTAAITDLSSLVVEGCIFAGVSGKAIYNTAGSNVYLARYAHNLEYSIGGRFSANILDNSEDIVTGSNPFSSGEVLNAVAVQYSILTPSGNSYTTIGAMQAQITLPAASHVLNDQTAYGINANLSAGTASLPAVGNVTTAETAWGIASGTAGTLNMALYTLISGVVDASWVATGHDNYTGGAHGSYQTTATSYAVQLALDKAVVAAQAAGIILGTQFVWSDATTTTPGTFDEAGRNTDPGIANVLSGTHYTIHNAALIGSYSSTIVIDLEVSDVALEVA